MEYVHYVNLEFLVTIVKNVLVIILTANSMPEYTGATNHLRSITDETKFQKSQGEISSEHCKR